MLRTGRWARHHPGVRDRDTVPIGHPRPRERASWIAWSPAKAALLVALAVGVAVTLTPGTGAAGDIATRFVRAVRHLTTPTASATSSAALVGDQAIQEARSRGRGWPIGTVSLSRTPG